MLVAKLEVSKHAEAALTLGLIKLMLEGWGRVLQ